MRHGALLAGAAMIVTAHGAKADDKPLIVYVSPNPIGVNDFLKLGKAGTEKIADQLGAAAKVFESTDPTTQRQNLEAAAKQSASWSRSASSSTTSCRTSPPPIPK